MKIACSEELKDLKKCIVTYMQVLKSDARMAMILGDSISFIDFVYFLEEVNLISNSPLLLENVLKRMTNAKEAFSTIWKDLGFSSSDFYDVRCTIMGIYYAFRKSNRNILFYVYSKNWSESLDNSINFLTNAELKEKLEEVKVSNPQYKPNKIFISFFDNSLKNL